MHTNSWWWGQWPWGHQYPWGVGGPWACCSRVRVQSGGLTASWQPGTYLLIYVCIPYLIAIS